MKRMQLRSERDEEVIGAIRKGLVLIHPTDTLYGLGCDATNTESVEKIRKIKNSNHPFSVIAPSKEWVRQHTDMPEEYLEKLPGPYTFIVNMKDRPVAGNVSFSNKLGIRIPDHRFSLVVRSSGVPFITTSCNLSCSEPLTDTCSIPEEIESQADVLVDEGLISNPPSQVFDLTGTAPKRIR